MANLDHDDDEFVTANLIDDSIDAYPDPKERVTGQLLAIRWPRIRRESIDRLQNALDGRLRDAAEVLSDRRQEANLKSCRRLQVA